MQISKLSLSMLYAANANQHFNLTVQRDTGLRLIEEGVTVGEAIPVEIPKTIYRRKHAGMKVSINPDIAATVRFDSEHGYHIP